MMNAKPATRTTLHRALIALPYDALMSMATSYGIDTAMNRTDIEYALLAQNYSQVTRRTLTLLKRAFDAERL